MPNAKSSRRRFIKGAAAGTAGLIASSRALASHPASLVNITFEGMMVFHQNGNEYEVGVVDQSIAQEHQFSALLDGEPLFSEQRLKRRGSQVLPEILRFDIKRKGVLIKDTGPIKEGHKDRLRDDEDGQFDFNWIVDFEDKHFHRNRRVDDGHGGKGLYMIPNKLPFIIRLSSGRIYTKYKIAKLTRTQGDGDNRPVDFGFLTETIGFEITLKGPKEVLVISFQGQEYSVPYAAGRTIPIEFRNVIPPLQRHKESHFCYYYKLFPGIPREERYDIQLKDPPEYPYNHYPLPPDTAKPYTVGAYPCGPISLGSRTQPLE